ncbi:hypothetical protein BIV60_21080 [Bacillus sp. MUM 116]|uniref:hypothetical protein n=1 Tax=Bacillus sp. MUM 116 TaxID=1678002 RepID=UPI0008F5A4CE|nr:hypothetical protein [Bacillus sp. MUM 116]OIK10458.1 hypothetical protein BIV60_21080 [Bacillus sp. MUM 116]
MESIEACPQIQWKCHFDTQGEIANLLNTSIKEMEADRIGTAKNFAKAGEEKAKTLSNYGIMPFDLVDGMRELLNRF